MTLANQAFLGLEVLSDCFFLSYHEKKEPSNHYHSLALKGGQKQYETNPCIIFNTNFHLDQFGVFDKKAPLLIFAIFVLME